MKEVIEATTEALDDIGEALREVARAARELTEHFYHLSLEVMVMFGDVPGHLGTIIRLPISKRWAVAGGWLREDDDVNLPQGFRGRILSMMVRDVREGRLLADPGF